MMITRRALGTLAGAWALPSMAQRRTFRAVLVGVSEYPGLPEANQLKGPRNDITRLRALLLGRGFDQKNVAVLADGVRGAADLPTRVNIMQALKVLEEQCEANDLALLYFCGHGSQQPVRPGTPEAEEEPDGLHEIFLPRDVSALKPGDKSPRSVLNAIADHEFRRSVDRILAKGTFVWAVFDACHSATLVRSGPGDDIRYRQVSPQVLGFDDRELIPPRNPARSALALASETAAKKSVAVKGRAVYFYASQMLERAIEMPLPADARPTLQRVMGAFSYVLMQALESGVAITYRQLAQQIQVKFAVMNIDKDMVLSDRQRPAFSGSGLDAPVLMQTASGSAPQWLISEASAGSFTVQGGAYAGLAAGAIVAVMPTPLSRDADVLGYARVTSTDLFEAKAEPISREGKKALAPEALKAGQAARLVVPNLSYALRVAIELAPGLKTREGVRARSALDWLRRNGVPGVQVEWVDRTNSPDIVLRVEDGAVIYLGPTRSIPKQGKRRSGLPQVSLTESDGMLDSIEAVADRISRDLHTVSRATNLMRMADLVNRRPSGGNDGFRTTLTLRRKNGGERQSEPFARESVPILRNADQVDIEVANFSRESMVVNLLYIDAAYGITCWPARGATSPAIAPGSTQQLPPLKIYADPTNKEHVFGVERLAIIALPQGALKEDYNLSFLQQPALENARSGTPEDSLKPFYDAGFADYAMRGGGDPSAPSADTAIHVYSMMVVPPK